MVVGSADKSIQTYQRREWIIEQYCDHNPSFWDEVESILELLGYGGMSSDETETETSRTSVKQVHRRDKVWCDASLARMWEAVEEYNCFCQEDRNERKARQLRL